MSWFYNEIVRSGNAQARIKNFYPENGLVVLYDIKGVLEVGMTIIGDESGTTLTLSNFTISDEYDLEYEPVNRWTNFLEKAVYDGNGKLVALAEHFNGTPSQEYQTTYLVVNN